MTPDVSMSVLSIVVALLLVVTLGVQVQIRQMSKKVDELLKQKGQ